jgi:hypothetical protein
MATSTSLPYESGLGCWLMDYHPEFLANWNPQANQANRGITRKEILRHYSEVLPPVDEPYLEEVDGLAVAVDAPNQNSVIDFCLQLGYQVERRETEDVVALNGPDFALRLIPATKNVRGIRKIKMRASNLSKREKEHQLTQSTLQFAGSSAISSFR